MANLVKKYGISSELAQKMEATLSKATRRFWPASPHLRV